MRVLYVSKALVVRAYRDKLVELARRVDVRGVVPERWDRGTPERDGDRDALISFAPVWFPGHNHFHLYRDVARIVDEVRPDLVHVDEEPYSAVTVQLTRLCRRRSIPSLFFAWQNVTKRLPPPFGLGRQYVFARVNGAIAGTESAAGVLRALGYLKPLAVIPQFGVDPQRYVPNVEARTATRRRHGWGREMFVVGYGGRLVKAKGVAVLIDAVRTIPDACLDIVGDGPDRTRLESRVAARDLRGRVCFRGHLPSTAMPEWLNALDVLVLPSLTTRGWVEQFGRILVEAMATGVPVIGSASGEIPTVIDQAGLVVPEGDCTALGDALRRVQGDTALRESLGRRGRARVLAHFTHARIAERTATFYEAVGSNAP